MDSRIARYPVDLSKEILDSFTLCELLRLRAHNYPNKLAYAFLPDGDTGEINLTYAELDRQARAVAASLQTLGAAGGRALLLYPPGLEFIAAFFGCLYAGVVAVPAYPARNARGVHRLRAIVKDAQAGVVLTTSSIFAMSNHLFAQASDLADLRWLATDKVEADAANDWQQLAFGKGDLAFLQYTSGSTGKPKGVMLTHGNLLHNAGLVYNAVEHTSDDRYISWLPTFHDMGFMAGVLEPLYAAIPVILISPVSFLARPLRWLQLISHYRGTTSGGPNFGYDLCARKITEDQIATLDLSSWTVAFNGAEPIRAETLERFTRTFERCGFRSEVFYPCYGLAEATLIVCGGKKSAPPIIKTVQYDALQADGIAKAVRDNEDAKSMVGCGSALGGLRVAIVDPETFLERAPGEVGEIWVSGPSVSTGYWNNPEETERTFHARIADSGEGPFLRTGDLGYLQNGELFFAGRIKDLIIIRGANYYPQDIELTVEKCQQSFRPGCNAAFSVDVASEERLVIVQELDPRKQPDTNAAMDAIRLAIAEEHELQVHAIALIPPGTIPKTSSGKIQRRATKEAFLKGSLNALAEWRGAQSVEEETEPPLFKGAPESLEDIQGWLASQVAAKLGVNRSEIDVNQPVAQYGIDSLIDIELIHSIQTTLSVSLPVLSFLQSASVAEIASLVLDKLKQSHPPVDSLAPAQQQQREFPLSYGQQALWFLHQLDPGNAAYNIARALRIPKDVNVPALKQAFQALVDRHPSLRTGFKLVEERPAQFVLDRMEVCFNHEDASAWSEETLTSRLVEEAHRPFDLEAGPVFKVSLFTRANEAGVLLIVVHHIVTDLWSMAVLLRELSALYEAEESGARANLPALNLSYADYVRWQMEMLAGSRGEQLWRYWQERLSGDLPALDLPMDYPRPAQQTYAASSLSIKLSRELREELKAIARESGATLYMVLLAAYQVLLYRHTGQEELLVGSPTTGRGNAQLEGLVGYFVNPVVIRANLSGSNTFQEFLAQVRQTVLKAFEHQDYPFLLLTDRLQPQRDSSRSPLFQTMFTLQKAPLFADRQMATLAIGESGAQIKLGSLVLESVELQQQQGQFDVMLMMAETDEGLTAFFQYNTDIFEPTTIERMSARFANLLGEIVKDPSQKVSRLAVLTQPELDQILVKWNDTSADYPNHLCLHQLIEQQVERAPDAVAVEFREQRLSYRELNERANQVAHHLRKLGVGPEQAVGVCMHRGLEMMVSLLGVLKSGGAYIPLEPDYPSHRLKVMVDDAEVKVLLTDGSAGTELAGESRAIVRVDLDQEISSASKSNPENLTGPENLAYIIYTSGSTGKPKGAMNTHRGISNRLLWMQDVYGLGPDDKVLQKTPYSFDVSVWEIFWGLMVGATVVVAEPGGHQDSAYIVSEIKQRSVTTLHFVPSMLEVFLQEEGVERCSSIKRVICSGEALTYDLQEKYFQRMSGELENLYGPTEAAVDVTRWRCERGSRSRRVPIGRPIGNIKTYILDKEMNVVGVGVKGELHLGGVGVGRGYLGRPDLTAERFIANPYGNAGERIYKTGDEARYLEDGAIEYLGRVDEQVKIRGMRVELGEIEEVMRGHRAVGEAVVAARGESKALVGYVVLRAGEEASGSELREYVRERLPEHMVPSVIVELEKIPLNANGKIDRKALPVPELSGTDDKPYVAPRGPVEEIVAGIFREVIKQKQVSAIDNFFNIGGNSLLATQCASRIRKAFGIDFPLRKIFDSPFVRSIAQAIEASRREQRKIAIPPLLPVPRDTELPLSFAQQRLWFIDQLDPDSYAYNMPGALELRGPLDVSALERSLNEILRRHEALRTTFRFADGRPVQNIAQELKLDLQVNDLSNLDERDRQQYVLEEGFKEARTPFNIAEGPLLRAKLVRLACDQHVLFLAMHHIVSDGWSLDVFLREIAALYEAFSSGKPSPLAELPIQYADFAVWQRQWLQGEALETLLSYWKDKLSGELPVAQLPADRARPAVASLEGDRQTVILSRELSAAIKSLSREAGVTLFMTLSAAFKSLLYRYSGQEDIIVGAPIANRNQAETEGLIGFFVNTLILRDSLSGDMSFRELLRRVRETAMDAYAHQDLPFERLVEELQPERDTSRNPLFQTMIVLQDAPMAEFNLSGLIMSPVEVGGVTTKFIDLTLGVIDADEGLVTSFEYSTDLFEASTIARMLAHFETMLKGIADNPSARLSELPMLTEREREQILIEWNDTNVNYPFELCMHQLVEISAERSPDALAIVSEEGRATYKELNERANQVAHYLMSLGVGPEVLVGICAERSVELVVAMLGILKAGGAYVPLDPEYPADRLASMLEDARPLILITQERLLDRLPDNDAQVVCIDRDWGRISRESTANAESGVVADNLAFVLYTSGSTGRPKGVMIFHRAACNHIFWIQHRFPMNESDRMPMKYSICFDASVFEIFYTLYAGARLVMVRQGMQQDLVYLVSLMEEHKITILDLVGAQLQVLMDDERFLKCDWLRRVSCGNDAMLAEVKERYFREMGKELIHFYGPCETSIGSTCMVCEPGGDHQVVSIGRPISNTQVYVVDPHLQPVAVGIVGEIVIGGIGVTRGYLRRPDVTAEKFIPNPFSNIPGDRLYKTGDLARYRPDGTMEFAGRVDHQVKIRGFRIELGDIEAVIKEHPSVQEVLVLARSEDEFGSNGAGKLLAISNGGVDEKSLADHLALLGAEAADQLLAEMEMMSESEAGLLLANENKPYLDARASAGKSLAEFAVAIPAADDELIKSAQDVQLT